MAAFTVHLPPAPAGAAPAPEQIVFLRDGFSWWAFLLGPFWLAWNRAWLALLAWTLLLVLVGLVGWKLHLTRLVWEGIGLGLGAILGFEGTRLVAWNLARRGFTESAVVIGENADEAEEAYFHRILSDGSRGER